MIRNAGFLEKPDYIGYTDYTDYTPALPSVTGVNQR